MMNAQEFVKNLVEELEEQVTKSTERVINKARSNDDSSEVTYLIGKLDTYTELLRIIRIKAESI